MSLKSFCILCFGVWIQTYIFLLTEIRLEKVFTSPVIVKNTSSKHARYIVRMLESTRMCSWHQGCMECIILWTLQQPHHKWRFSSVWSDVQQSDYVFFKHQITGLSTYCYFELFIVTEGGIASEFFILNLSVCEIEYE